MFGHILKTLREDRDLKQEDIAKYLNVDRSTVGKWENNSSKPDFEKLIKIANFFNVSTDYLLGKTDNTTDEQYYLNGETRQIAQEIKDNPELRALFDASRNATPEDLEITKDILLKLKRKEQGRTD